MSTIYATLINQINQYKYKNHLLFSARFHKIKDKDQKSAEIELHINLNNNLNLIESDDDNIDIKSQLEQQNRNEQTKESGWLLYRVNSMRSTFVKTGELNGSSYMEVPLRSNAT